MKIEELIKKNGFDADISKYDYKTISKQTDLLYNTLLYKDIYPIENREEKFQELLEYINFFKRLPNARKIMHLKFLDRLHTLYLANLALCNGEAAKALKYYFEVLSVREINKKIKDIRSKKCSRIELCDLMPIVYNIESIYRLVGLDSKANEYLSLCNEAIFMWTEKMKETKPDGFVFHPLKDASFFEKSGYEFCCEEYYDKNTGRNNYRFNAGLDDFEIIKPEVINKDGKECIKLSYCSDLISKEKLINIEAAKIRAEVREF